jgi:hypothetical protein
MMLAAGAEVDTASNVEGDTPHCSSPAPTPTLQSCNCSRHTVSLGVPRTTMASRLPRQPLPLKTRSRCWHGWSAHASGPSCTTWSSSRRPAFGRCIVLGPTCTPNRLRSCHRLWSAPRVLRAAESWSPANHELFSDTTRAHARAGAAAAGVSAGGITTVRGRGARNRGRVALPRDVSGSLSMIRGAGATALSRSKKHAVTLLP